MRNEGLTLHHHKCRDPLQRHLHDLHRNRKSYSGPPKVPIHALIHTPRPKQHTLQRQPVEEILLVLDALRVLRQLREHEDTVRRRHEGDIELSERGREEPVRGGQAFRVEGDERGELRPGEEVREVEGGECIGVPVGQEGEGGKEFGILLGDETALGSRLVLGR